MMKFEIKSRFDSSVLFSVETESLKRALELAVKQGADLRGADLRGADLRGADLRGADLRGATGLEKFPVQIGGHRHWLLTTNGGKLRIGCHIYTFEEWEKHADAIGRKEKYSPLDIEIYKLHIAHIKKVSQLLWNAKEKK
jgi:pentapeptide repeat protein